jgi:DNA processing protein
MADLSEAATLLALVGATKTPWYAVADLVERAGSATAVATGSFDTDDPTDLMVLNQIRTITGALDVEHWQGVLEELATQLPDVRLITVLDDAYPRNLRLVYDRPPFLFVRGDLRSGDDRAIAIVGTRQASERGRAEAARLAGALSRHGVTILSGLARGIDAAAHDATLRGQGRTIAVMGTGIRRIYPPEHSALADQIVQRGGALVSQFWPDAPPMASNFPLRNAVMSGMAVGTVVVEASSTSGARMQARLALEHGKRLFLLESLVTDQEWAQRYASRPGTAVVKHADEVLEILAETLKPAKQLQFA